MNIQDEVIKIHSKYGITEKANYEIQLLTERYAKEYHESEIKKLGIGVVSNSCLICGKELDKETAEHGNGTCSEYCNAKHSGYPMPSDYSEGLQKLVDN